MCGGWYAENSSEVWVNYSALWTSGSWENITTPTSAGAGDISEVRSFSCSVTGPCMAVGWYNPPGDEPSKPFSLVWKDDAWSLQSRSWSGYLHGVSCDQNKFCAAVGADYEIGPSTETWNGSAWSGPGTISLPDVTGGQLESVACTSESKCTAVGAGYSHLGSPELGSPYVTLEESWNGTAWTEQTTPRESEVAPNWLAGISCFSVAGCTAVGYTKASDNWGSLIETQMAAPETTTQAASGAEGVEATLNGTVIPEGTPTKYYFEYGATTSYGAKTAEVSVGSGFAPVAESKVITGLEPASTYHYRIVATNSKGTTHGADEVVTTRHWSLQPAPNPEPAKKSYLGESWCASSTSCVAAGYSENNAGAFVTLAESWNGSEWRIQSTPNPAGARESRVYGVTCSSSTACTAVGYYVSSGGTWLTLAERWNGTEWKIQSTPAPAGATTSRLLGVSCPSSSACTATGSYENGSGVTLPLAEAWNGSEWKVQSTPSPEGAKRSDLGGVSCTSSAACTAVGSYENGSHASLTLAEAWNGTEWKVQSTPSPEGGRITTLRGVSCPSSTICTAVGYYVSSAGVESTLAERWNGTEWKVQSMPGLEGGEQGHLTFAVSCPSTTACTATGMSYQSGEGRPLAESWNGTEWKVQSVPYPEGAKEDQLTGVQCPTTTACAAVGFYENSSGVTETLAERYSGATWTVEPTPNPREPAKKSYLGESWCASSTSCVAAGYSENNAGAFVTLAESWNGSEWRIQSTPNPAGARESRVYGVTCSSSTACTAVGYYVSSGGTWLTLAERWNGTEWKSQSTPAPAGATTSRLLGVSCPSSSACTATGSYENGSGVTLPLAEAWNGSEWKVQSTPSPEGAKRSDLGGVSCTSSAACTAVGSYENGSHASLTLAEAWNGTEWKVQSTPSPEGGRITTLRGVSCPSSTICTAVGYYVSSAGVESTLAERWNGTEWKVQSMPGLEGGEQGHLTFAVSCPSTTACTATGMSYQSGEGRPLAESWNGTEWKVQSVPYPEGAKEDQLTGVQCPTTTACAAVGFYENSSGVTETLAERYSGVPENKVAPVISPATPDQAAPETVSTGMWTDKPSFSYQWERCNAIASECVDIPEANSSDYTPEEADVGHTLIAEVTATNDEGSSSVFAAATTQVQPIGEISEYALPVGTDPEGITTGPDGNLWFTGRESSKIGKITTAGTITEYSLPSGSEPTYITAGSDGNLWFVDQHTSKIGKITTAGTITEYSLPSGSEPTGIVGGPDGDLWFTEWTTSKIGKITTSGTITEYALPSGSYPRGITAGPDGKLWFALAITDKIGKITTAGAITEYSLPSLSDPDAITAGPDGKLWFVDSGDNKIGKITTAGAITEYSMPSGLAIAPAITAGADGNLWFARYSNKVGKITTAGTVTEYTLSGYNPGGITAGPDNNLWFTEAGGDIGKITP